MLHPTDCPAYVLAGGSSSRFGSDKARIEVHGQIQLLRLLQALESQGHRTRVIADREDRFKDLGVTCLEDVFPERGPLAGLASALRHREQTYGTGWLLLLCCDQVRWQTAWFELLAGRAGPAETCVSESPEAVAFHATSSAQRHQGQPIPALYHTCIAPRLRKQLGSSDRSLRALVRTLRSEEVSCDENPHGWSFNTPQELARILERL